MFWALNGMIAEAENCTLDISKKYIRASAACDLGLTVEEFDNFISFIIEDCELLFVTAGGLTNDTLQETLGSVMDERVAARDRKNGKRKSSPELLNSSPELSQSSPNSARTFIESRVKESKVKESRVKEREEEAQSAPAPEELEPEISEPFTKSDYSPIVTEIIQSNHGPTLEEIQAYCEGAGIDFDVGKSFHNHFESVGWVSGQFQTPIRNWRPALEKWARNEALYKMERKENVRNKTHSGRNDRGKGSIDLDKYARELATCTAEVADYAAENLNTS